MCSILVAQKLRTCARYTVTVPWNISIIVLGEGFPIIAEAVWVVGWGERGREGGYCVFSTPCFQTCQTTRIGIVGVVSHAGYLRLAVVRKRVIACIFK